MVVPEGLNAPGRSAFRRAIETLTAVGEDPALSAVAIELHARWQARACAQYLHKRARIVAEGELA